MESFIILNHLRQKHTHTQKGPLITLFQACTLSPASILGCLQYIPVQDIPRAQSPKGQLRGCAVCMSSGNSIASLCPKPEFSPSSNSPCLLRGLLRLFTCLLEVTYILRCTYSRATSDQMPLTWLGLVSLPLPWYDLVFPFQECPVPFTHPMFSPESPAGSSKLASDRCQHMAEESKRHVSIGTATQMTGQDHASPTGRQNTR